MYQANRDDAIIQISKIAASADRSIGPVQRKIGKSWHRSTNFIRSKLLLRIMHRGSYCTSIQFSRRNRSHRRFTKKRSLHCIRSSTRTRATASMFQPAMLSIKRQVESKRMVHLQWWWHHANCREWSSGKNAKWSKAKNAICAILRAKWYHRGTVDYLITLNKLFFVHFLKKKKKNRENFRRIRFLSTEMNRVLKSRDWEKKIAKYF